VRRIERGMRTDRKRPDYHDLKTTWTDAVSVLCRAQRLRRLSPMYAARFLFVWHEPDRKRDPDNVAAGGRKLILDGLVAAGVLETDGARHVGAFVDEFEYDDDRLPAGVVVSACEVAGADHQALSLTIPHRLPDLNELLAAREIGALRGARFRASARGQASAKLSSLARAARAGKARSR